MNNRGYYVLKQCHEWQYVPELGQSVWVETSAEQVTPYRATKQEAEQDYAKLGLTVHPPHSYNAMIILYQAYHGHDT